MGGGIKDIDVIIHIAASLSGDTNTLIRNNIEATKSLVCWAEQERIKRFIYISTVSVYGAVEGELCETSDMNNTSIYGLTKHLAESIVKESEIPEKLIIQLPRMIGPYVNLKDIKDSGFLTMTKKILMGEDVTCFIPETAYNNYLHVSELGVFLKHLLNKDKWAENETVLLGAQERLTMLQILQIMRDAIGSKSKIIANSNGSKPECSLINIDKAKKMGFCPCTAESMLKRFINEINVKITEGVFDGY